MRTIEQKYIVTIEVLENENTIDMSENIKQAMYTGLLPEDGMSIISVEKHENN